MARDHELAVIGAGSPSRVAARVAAGLGSRAALVERDRVGGDCTWTCCIPSKALLHAARVAELVRRWIWAARSTRIRPMGRRSSGSRPGWLWDGR